MSIQAISWAYSLENLDDPITRFVLVTLCNYADDYGVCWPSVATLVDDLRCSERKLRNCIASLEKAGLLRRIERRRDNGSRRSNAYLLLGFEGRKKPTEPGDHPIIAPQDLVDQTAADTNNRHQVPYATTGTTCRGVLHHMQGDPAPRAPLEPSIEPSIEPTPLTPTDRRHKNAGRRSRAHGDPPSSETAKDGRDEIASTAELIRQGKPYLCTMISAYRARQCVSAGLVSIDDCRKAGVPI